jgi:enoyl-CoA hydratase/carnithine racemase
MKAGLPPAAIMAYLGRYALPKRVFPMVLFGDPLTPAVALDAGLITQVSAPEELAGDADALTQRILALNEGGARQCKAFFQAAEENALEQNFRFATETLTVTSLRLMQSR